jgi:hypothetical protein
MNRSMIRNLAVAALIAYPALAIGADQVPDIKSKWIGKTHTILVGKGGHWPTGRGTGTSQHCRFWGVTTLSGGGKKTDEPFIGELAGKDNRSFVFADTDGFWEGQLDADALSFCYRHTTTTSTVVSCTEVKRTR